MQCTSTDRDGLELRYDGPIPAWERPQQSMAVQIRGRMRLHRRLALEYATEARRSDSRAEDADTERSSDFHRECAVRARRAVMVERRAHSRYAATLGQIIRPILAHDEENGR